MRNFPTIFLPGEEVVATEKIHRTNCRVGLNFKDGQPVEMAGSKQIRRKQPANLAGDLYWFPWTVSGVRELLHGLIGTPWNARQVILFGEVFGKVQSLRYGIEKGLGF